MGTRSSGYSRLGMWECKTTCLEQGARGGNDEPDIRFLVKKVLRVMYLTLYIPGNQRIDCPHKLEDGLRTMQGRQELMLCDAMHEVYEPAICMTCWEGMWQASSLLTWSGCKNQSHCRTGTLTALQTANKSCRPPGVSSRSVATAIASTPQAT